MVPKGLTLRRESVERAVASPATTAVSEKGLAGFREAQGNGRSVLKIHVRQKAKEER